MTMHYGAISLLIASTIVLVLTTVTTTLRCITRTIIVKAFGTDDWLMVVAQIMGFGMLTASLVNAYITKEAESLNVNQSGLPPDLASRSYMWWWIAATFTPLTISFARISIGFFFLRLTVDRIQRILVYLAMLSTVLSGTVGLFINVFRCTPVNYFWLRVYEDSQGHCISNSRYLPLVYTYGTLSACCDMTLVLVPILILWKLQVSWTTKLGLGIVMGTAEIACCAPLVRMSLIYTLGSPEFIFDTIGADVWTAIEPGLGMTASNLATLKPLIRVLRKWTWPRSENGKIERGPGKFVMRSLQTIKMSAATEERHYVARSRQRGAELESLDDEVDLMSPLGQLQTYNRAETAVGSDRESTLGVSREMVAGKVMSDTKDETDSRMMEVSTLSSRS